MGVQRKRVYDPVAGTDGARVLVDGLWPRGISLERAALDRWARGLAPSPRLRRWFGHRPERRAAFERAYRAELMACEAQLARLAQSAANGRVTLVYAARDRDCNHAAVLEAVINERLHSRGRGGGAR